MTIREQEQEKLEYDGLDDTDLELEPILKKIGNQITKSNTSIKFFNHKRILFNDHYHQ